MSGVPVDDVLAAILEKYLSDAKKLFSVLKDGYVERINRVQAILKDVLDRKADESTLRQAHILLKQANYVAFVPGKDTVGGRVLADAIRSAVRNVSDDVAKKRSAPMTYKEIFEEYKFSPKAQAAFLKGVTIGELFVIQPDLFL